MSENEKQDSNQEAVPFFARYLEGQTPEEEEMSEEEMDATAGGLRFVTLKYPSDQEDGLGGGGSAVTRKYPSDSDEGFAGNQFGIKK